MKRKEKAEQVRDHIVPILVDQARLEMMRMYKPGMVDPVGEASVGVLMSTEPLRTIRGPFIQTDFYACYKMVIPLKPTVDVKEPTCRELLQEHVQARIHASNINLKKSKGDTLLLYMIDFYVTREGEIWHEEGEGLWRKVLQLPPGTLQASLLNLKTSLNVRYLM